jgi:RNA polymerase sigma factor (sigma-70 family)
VLRFGVAADQAEDIAQDVALALHQTPDIQDRRALAWGIAWCKAVTYRRGRGRRFRAMQRIATDLQTQEHHPPSAEEQMSAHGASAMLRRAIEELRTAAPRLHAVLSLHLDGLSAPEIAAKLSIPHGTVDTRLKDARAAVRAQMSRWTAEIARREQWAQLTGKGAPKRWR